jgi:hypothetical protein
MSVVPAEIFADFKTKVVLGAIRGQKTVMHSVSEYDVQGQDQSIIWHRDKCLSLAAGFTAIPCSNRRRLCHVRGRSSVARPESE